MRTVEISEEAAKALIGKETPIEIEYKELYTRKKYHTLGVFVIEIVNHLTPVPQFYAQDVND